MLIPGYIVAAIAAYLLGSVPTGFLVGRAKGIDIRTVGSMNMGATNVFRTLGPGPGIIVLAVDALKGWLACAVIGQYAVRWFADINSAAAAEYFPIVAGFSAVLGHNYTCWLNFKGGKGIATSAGVMLALFKMALLVDLGVWVLVFAVSRYVSLASIAAAFWLPVFVWIFNYSSERFWVSALMGVLAIYKHKPNIQRLMAGTEKRLGEKAVEPADEPKSNA